MTTFGITPAGFVAKKTDACFNDIVTAMRANVDANFDLAPDQPLGQMAQITASELAELWDLARALYSGLNPENAEGFILDGVCAYTGTERDEPSNSTVVCAMGLNGSTTVNPGATANVLGQPTNTWTLVGPANFATGQLISEGPVVSTTAGTYYGFFKATQPGPVLANAGQLTVITTAVTGWNTVTNPAGCVLGTLVQSDSTLQTKRDQEIAAEGASTTDAIKAALLEIKTSGGVAAIQQAFVYENTGDTTDANGVLPHSLHVLIYDGIVPQATNQQVVDVIWSQKPSGINTVGATSARVIDSVGESRTIYFDRVVPTPVYLSLTTTRGPDFDNVNGPAAIKAALVAYWAKHMGVGVPMIARFIGGAVTGDTIKGLLDIPDFFIGFTYSPVVTVTGAFPSYNGILTLNTGVDGSGHAFILVDGA